jgi:hypothetical protein
MSSWVTAVLLFVSVPLALILGGLAVAGMAIWVSHKNRMAKLEIQEKERQAEADREMLGLGSKDLDAHVQALLERMKSVEGRLDRMEAMANIEAAKGRRTIPITGATDQDTGQSRRQEQVQ